MASQQEQLQGKLIMHLPRHNPNELPWNGKSVQFTSRYNPNSIFRDSSLSAATMEIERNRKRIKMALKEKKEEKRRMKMYK